MRDRPDVCLLGLDPSGQGLRVVNEIATRVPSACVILLTNQLDEEEFMAAVRAGASGYLTQSLDPARLPFVVQGALRGEPAVPRRFVSRLLDELRTRERRRTVVLAGKGRVALTAREWEVAEMLLRSATTSEIAERARRRAGHGAPPRRLRRAQARGLDPGRGRRAALGRGRLRRAGVAAHTAGSVNETQAPPCGRFSAQIRPPCASTRPRAIARPRPGAAAAARAVGAPEALEHPRRRLRRQPFAGVLDAQEHDPPSRRSTRTATEPSDGVCRSAFVSRLKRTRSNLSGASRASTPRRRRRRLSATPRASASGCEEPQRGVDERRDRHLLQLERERAGVDPRQLEQVVDERRERPHLLAQRRQVVVGGREAVLDRLEHRLHRGDRRAQVVARPGDELAPRVEELLERSRPSR